MNYPIELMTSNITTNNNGLNIFVNILFLISLAVIIPGLVVGILALFKIKIKKSTQIYLYSFATGLIIILGIVGFIGEAITHAKEALLNENNNDYEHVHTTLKLVPTLKLIGVVGGGCLIGIGIIVLTKLIVNLNKHDLHAHHEFHDHSEILFNTSDIDNKKIKWLPIILLTGHRAIDGITLGFMANTDNYSILGFENWGMIIVFILHLVPTSIIIYLIHLDIQNNNRIKAYFWTLLMLLIMIPFTFMGGYLTDLFNKIWWLMPLLYSTSGTLMTINTIMEIIPEFIHYRNANFKQWTLIILLMGAGILLSIILICIHSH